MFSNRIESMSVFADDIGATMTMHGTAFVLERNGWQLSEAGERQALPMGSSPLMIVGHGIMPHPPCIIGQGWNEKEIRTFAYIAGAVVVYEREIQP